MNKLDIDYVLLGSALLLSLIGIAFIYSATHHFAAQAGLSYYQKQIIWLAAGIITAIIIYFIPLRVHEAMAYVYYAIAVALLILVLVFSKSGTARWFQIGDIAIQPVEFMKMALCLALARFLAYRRAKQQKFSTIFAGMIIVAIPTLLVIKQPDLGSSLVGIAIFFGLLIWTGAPISRILMVISPVISIVTAFHWLSWAIFFVAFLFLLYMVRPKLLPSLIYFTLNLSLGMITPILWNRLHEYQRLRILTFLDPGQDPAGAGYQIIQSKIAIGSGGFWGKGFIESTQTKLNYLPAQHTDFIYSVIGEEMGFVGCVIVIILFAALIIRGFMIAYKVRNTFYSYVAGGLISAVLFQTIINIGMTLGLMPVTGLPLPFVSYGGSSMLFFWSAIGLLLAINRDWQEY
ncbi:MAG: rod shape-determining protein RodA [candidate division Zixibacteria bacterium]|nr:rod shape-determining protein RodA [candidate division Zixibacteria bacterium]